MGRYDNINKIKDKGITRIGTSYLPKVDEENSISSHSLECYSESWPPNYSSISEES